MLQNSKTKVVKQYYTFLWAQDWRSPINHSLTVRQKHYSTVRQAAITFLRVTIAFPADLWLVPNYTGW